MDLKSKGILVNSVIGEQRHIVHKVQMPELSIEYCLALIQRLHGQYQLMAELMLFCGMRPNECVSVRVKDVDLDNSHLVISTRSGFVSRQVNLSSGLNVRLQKHMSDLKSLHEFELAEGFGYVQLPTNINDFKQSNEFDWQWLFSTQSLCLTETANEHVDRKDIILSAFNERIKRTSNVYGLDAPIVVTADIFWRCYLAGV